MGEIKICGTTSETDLEIAANAGADEVGIICHPSRQTQHTVDRETAQDLVYAAGFVPHLKTVLIPRSTSTQEVLEMMRQVKPDRVQLGESEDPELTKNVSPPQSKTQAPIAVSQVIHIGKEVDMAWLDRFLLYVDRIHLDSEGERPGGNGVTHDWDISREIAERAHAVGKKVMLAGGLTSENVAEAIAIVKPDGVDVETGIKGRDGSHDPDLVSDFVKNAKAAFDQLETVK